MYVFMCLYLNLCLWIIYTVPFQHVSKRCTLGSVCDLIGRVLRVSARIVPLRTIPQAFPSHVCINNYMYACSYACKFVSMHVCIA